VKHYQHHFVVNYPVLMQVILHEEYEHGGFVNYSKPKVI